MPSNVDNSNNITVGTGNAKIWVAPYSETLAFPSATDPTTAMPAAYSPLGYTTDDGVTLSASVSTTDVNAWQQEYAVRTLVTGRTFTLAFSCLEWNENTLKLALGGGTFTSTSEKGSYVPPVSGEVDERAMVVEWTDGAKKFRIVVPRGIATADVSSTINRTSAAVLPVTFNANPKSDPTAGEPSTFPYYFVTNAKGLNETVTS